MNRTILNIDKRLNTGDHKMRTIESKKRLVFSKVTIAHLNDGEMNRIHAGEVGTIKCPAICAPSGPGGTVGVIKKSKRCDERETDASVQE